MKEKSELSKFKKAYKYYLFGMILMTALLCYFVYVSYGFITIEGLLAGMFVVFFTVIVYLGSLIIELDRKVDELDAKLEKKKK